VDKISATKINRWLKF